MSSSPPGPGRCRGAERQQLRRLVVHVDQHAHAVAQVQLARALRDVGGRVVVAEQRFEPRVARLGDDLAVAVGVELVDHHAVVADQLAQRAAPRASASAPIARRLAEALHRGAQLRSSACRSICDAVRSAAAAGRPARAPAPARRRRTRCSAPSNGASRRPRRCATAAAAGSCRSPACAQRAHARAEVAAELAPARAQQRVCGQPSSARRWRWPARTRRSRLAQHQQHAVRLHRAGQVDQLALAVGQVGLAEGRAGRHDRVQGAAEATGICRPRARPLSPGRRFAVGHAPQQLVDRNAQRGGRRSGVALVAVHGQSDQALLDHPLRLRRQCRQRTFANRFIQRHQQLQPGRLRVGRGLAGPDGEAETLLLALGQHRSADVDIDGRAVVARRLERTSCASP